MQCAAPQGVCRVVVKDVAIVLILGFDQRTQLSLPYSTRHSPLCSVAGSHTRISENNRCRSIGLGK
jgi:hypothetical protein